MADRFLFEKLASGTSRSTGFLGAASARAAAPVTRTGPAASYINAPPSAKTSRPPCEMPLINIYYRKPLFAGCVRGARQTFSSSATNKQASSQGKMQPEDYSVAAHFQAMNKSANTTLALYAFSGLCWVYMFSNNSSGGRTSWCNCCNCQCHGLNHEVKRN